LQPWGWADKLVAVAMLNPKHLRAFLAVARSGSVGRAAQILRRAQSAVTRSLRELETVLDCALFERHAHGVTLTDQGHLLLHRVERAFGEMETARAALDTEPGEHARARAAPVFTLSIARQRLLAFAELAEQHSMAAVADRLGISQPAVSQALHDIESGIGMPLFKRMPNGMLPTPAGALLALHVRRALAELRIAEDEIASSNGVVQGRLSVGALSLGRTRLLPLAMTRLIARYPGVTIRTEEGSFEHLATLLRDGQIDFILGALRPPEHTMGFHREIVTHDRMAIVVRAGHPFAGRPAITLDEIVSARWALPQKGAPTRDLLEAALRARSAGEAQIQVETTDLAVLLGVLLGSDMVTAVSPHLFHREIEAGALAVLPIELPETERPIGILRRAGGVPSAPARLLMDMIHEIGGL
jgi:LysR family transcriptional regulator of gallate degradation